MAQYDGSIRINTLLNTSGLRRGEGEIRGSMSRISDAAKKMAAVIAGAFAVGKIVQFGKEALEAASDFEAMEAQFSQVFGELEASASASLSKIAKDTGITEERMKSSYTKIAAFAKTTGMDTASSLELADRAMMAVADSAAFYDRSLEETTESLQSFLKGNYENDAALGLSATEFTRNAAANKLYGKSFIELSEAQKQLTLLQMVEDANMLSGAMGQASRESDTWTNQTGNLNQAWTNLKANIGKFVLPLAIKAVKVVSNVINAINALLAKLYTAASAFRAFSELITGNKSQSGTSSGLSKSEGEDISSGYNAAADGAENLAEANEDAAKSARKAAKATKGQLSALDKFNNLSSQNSDSGGGSGGSGGGIVGVIEDVDYGKVAEGETQFEKLGGVLDAIISKAKELAVLFKQGFFDGLGDYKPRLEDLKKDILSVGRTLKEIFTDPGVLAASNRFTEQLSYSLGQITGSIASVGLTIAQNLVGGMEKYLTQNKERIKQYIVSMFDIGTEISGIIGDFSVAYADIFSVFGGDTAQKISGNLIGIFAEVTMLVSENAAKLGRDILDMITQPIIDNKEKIKTAIEGVLQAIEPFTSGLLLAFQTVRDAVSDIYDNHLKPLFDSIASGLSEILGKLLDGFNTYILPVFQGLGEKFEEIMNGPFGETVNKVKDFIGKLIDVVKLFWENVLVPFFGWIADNIVPVLAPIVNFIGETVMSVIETFINIVGDIAEVLGGVIDFIVGVFTGDWKKAWEGIKSIFSGVWNTIKDFFSGIWNILKSLVKNGIDYVKAFIKSGWEWIKLITSTVWNAIKGVLSTIWNGLKALVSTVFNAIKKAVSTVWNGIKSITSTVWNGIKTAISTVINGIKTKITTVLNIIKTIWSTVWTGLKTTVTNIFNGIWKVIKGVINSILSGIEGMANGVIKGINFVISALNKLHFDIPDWVPALGGKSFGFDIPELKQVSIPRLATGAVIPANKEFLAVLGDQKHGTNIEAPLDTIKQAVREELGSLSNQSGSGNIELHLTVECEGYKLLQLIQKLDREQFARTQRPSFQI